VNLYQITISYIRVSLTFTKRSIAITKGYLRRFTRLFPDLKNMENKEVQIEWKVRKN